MSESTHQDKGKEQDKLETRQTASGWDVTIKEFDPGYIFLAKQLQLLFLQSPLRLSLNCYHTFKLSF